MPTMACTSHASAPADIIALPNPCPVVTVDLAQHLYRLSSQHYCSEYNQQKRSVHIPHQTVPPVRPSSLVSSARSHSAPVINKVPSCPQPQCNNLNPSKQDSNATKRVTGVLGSYFSALTCPWNNEHGSATSAATRYQPTATSITGSDTPWDTDCTSAAVGQIKAESPSPFHKTPTAGHDVSHHPHEKEHTVKTSLSHPMNISPILPPELLCLLSQYMLPLEDGIRSPSCHPLPVDLYDLTGPQSSEAYEVLASSIPDQYSQLCVGNISNSSTWPPSPLSPTSAVHRRLGNLLLSSCPGKKVRLENIHTQQHGRLFDVDRSTTSSKLVPTPFLSGSSHRSAICRDLDSDFARASAMGIQAVICCIDDIELRYLGSPWEKYSESAKKHGLSILRCPMADGFAPHCVTDVERLLEEVIQNWTLKGKDVLCHCRGGVGRAGLVACCWMIKCGLVGRAAQVTELLASPTTCGRLQGPGKAQQLKAPSLRPLLPTPEVFQQVQKVIEVIRRRRSAKAIETPYQVHYVMEYAQWISDRDQLVNDTL